MSKRIDKERVIINNIVRESCVDLVSIKGTDTVIPCSRKVYRELFYKDSICIGTRLINIKDGSVVNSSGEITFDKGVYIYGLSCPTNTTALLKTDVGLGRLTLYFINDVFKQYNKDLNGTNRILINMEDEGYAELLFGKTSKSYTDMINGRG